MKDPKNFLADLEPPKYDVIERSHADRDTWQETARQFCQNADYWRDRAEAAEARLAEVEAERDSARRTAETYLDKLAEFDTALTAVDNVLLNVSPPSWLDEIAARGEGDRG